VLIVGSVVIVVREASELEGSRVTGLLEATGVFGTFEVFIRLSFFLDTWLVSVPTEPFDGMISFPAVGAGVSWKLWKDCADLLSGNTSTS
jgi:hypothetical protein